MKKRNLITALLLAFLVTSGANAQNYKSAVGIRLSSNDAVINNAITFKHFFGSTALEAMLSFGDPVALGILLEKHRPLLGNGLTYFYGAGGYVGFGKVHKVGAQGVLGLDYKIPAIPFNLSIDWKPELGLVKEVFFEPSAVGLSARFTF